MRRLLKPFVLVLTLILGLAYSYLAWRILESALARLLLLAPFIAVWIVPVLYWSEDRRIHEASDDWIHRVCFVSMGWLNFLLVAAVLRDVVQLATRLARAKAVTANLERYGGTYALGASVLAMAIGVMTAARGPRLRRVTIPVKGLAPALDGFRIVQISDLHVGPTIRRRYVEQVVRMTNELAPDLIALTGDIVDGSVASLKDEVAPMAAFKPAGRAFLVLGNHEYYAGVKEWIPLFEKLGLRVLLNTFAMVEHMGAAVLVGGVIDPAAQRFDREDLPRPDLASGAAVLASMAPQPFRLLLAHNPKLTNQGAQAGFDLQLSGHTHAGQFFPWTLVVRLVHAPHAAGLSRVGKMWVYVSAGTGSWGPPVRFGTTTELTELRLVRAGLS